MKRRVGFLIVIVAIFFAGYSFGKHHEANICFEPSAVQMFLGEERNIKPPQQKAFSSDISTQTQLHGPHGALDKKYPTYSKVIERYRDLHDHGRVTTTDFWTACGNTCVSIEYQFSATDIEEDKIWIKEAQASKCVK